MNEQGPQLDQRIRAISEEVLRDANQYIKIDELTDDKRSSLLASLQTIIGILIDIRPDATDSELFEATANAFFGIMSLNPYTEGQNLINNTGSHFRH